MRKGILSGRIGAVLLSAVTIFGSIGLPMTAHAENQGSVVDLTYNTTGGKWTDSQGQQHNNGTFVIRIVKSIDYKNMNAGAVKTSDDYNVTVEGILSSGQKIDVKAESGNKLTGGFLGSITETTSLKDASAGGSAGAYSATNYHTFTDAQVSQMTGDRVTGMTVQDNIALNGNILSLGSYNGHVQYTAAIR